VKRRNYEAFDEKGFLGDNFEHIRKKIRGDIRNRLKKLFKQRS